MLITTTVFDTRECLQLLFYRAGELRGPSHHRDTYIRLFSIPGVGVAKQPPLSGPPPASVRLRHYSDDVSRQLLFHSELLLIYFEVLFNAAFLSNAPRIFIFQVDNFVLTV